MAKQPVLALHAPHRHRRRDLARRRSPPPMLDAGGAAAGGGGDNEHPERGDGPRGAEAVVLVHHVRETLVAGHRHEDALVAGEAVNDRAHLCAAGHLERETRRQAAEGRPARHGKDARRAAHVPRRRVQGGAGHDEAAAVAARQLHARLRDAGTGRRRRSRHGVDLAIGGGAVSGWGGELDASLGSRGMISGDGGGVKPVYTRRLNACSHSKTMQVFSLKWLGLNY